LQRDVLLKGRGDVFVEDGLLAKYWQRKKE
jgi:hypothetical protein